MSMKTLSGMDGDNSPDVIPPTDYRTIKNVPASKRGRFEVDADGKAIFIEDENGEWLLAIDPCKQ